MDHAAVAKRIREAIFQKAEEDGRVIQDFVDSVIEGILREVAPATRPYGYAMLVAGGPEAVAQTLANRVEPKEWR